MQVNLKDYQTFYLSLPEDLLFVWLLPNSCDMQEAQTKILEFAEQHYDEEAVTFDDGSISIVPSAQFWTGLEAIQKELGAIDLSQETGGTTGVEITSELE
ncbi:MAG: hypothetical protein LBV67_06955 [Streptococcaceae bacterium]|jgi:hypothetical protein|nr:hypothetical protein [Streptococcaceae bacterium]